MARSAARRTSAPSFENKEKKAGYIIALALR
jgi:hypothetical protein